MKTGLELLAEYKISLSSIRAAAVRIENRLAVATPAELPSLLAQMVFAIDPKDLPYRAQEELPSCDFQIWTDAEIWILEDDYGLTRMRKVPLSPAGWVADRQRWLE